MNAHTEESALRKELYKLVVARCRGVVQLSHLRQPPYRSEIMAQQLGIRVVPTLLGPSLSALLIPLGGGRFVARVNSAHSTERQNFSLAHEIGHTFLMHPDASHMVEKLSGMVGLEEYRGFEETLCNVAASELLMPYFVFHQYASRYDFSIDGVVPLSEMFVISIAATAIRLGQVSPRQCYVIQWTNSEKSPSEQPKLRVSWAVSSKTRLTEGRSSFTSLKMLTDPNCNAFEAYDSDCPVRSREFLALKGFRGLCDIESQGFGRGQHRYVISLVFPRDKPI